MPTSLAALASLAGTFEPAQWKQRPFRAPHHSATAPALVGGGSPPRPGEISLAYGGVLFLDEMPEMPRAAEVIAPNRTWDQLPASRVSGTSSLWGEKLSVTLADEILLPGAGKIRGLINASGNPAVSMPDSRKFARALDALERLVTVDPFMTATARKSDYVLPVKMMYERFDLPLTFMGMPIYTLPWAQWARPLLHP